MALPDVSNLDPQTKDELAALALQLSSDKKTRKPFLRQIKELAPNTPIPELDEVDAVDARLAERDKHWEEKFKAFEDKDRKKEFESLRAKVKDDFKFGDDDFKKMEEMMTKKELPADYTWAAKLYQQQIQPATPTYDGGGYGPVDLPGDEGLMQDEQRWSLTTAHQMIDDMHRQGNKF